MRIVDRETFLQLPVPTFFVKVDPMGRLPGMDMLEVKVLNAGTDDFYSTDFMWHQGREVADEATTRRNMLEHEPITVQDTCGRDGLYDDDQLFLVYDLEDLKIMKGLLDQAVLVAALKMLDGTFAPIATAPRNGTLVIVGHEDVGTFPMRWDAIAKNELFAPGEVGMWVMSDGSMTWCSEGGGPSHWKPVDMRSVN